MLVTVDEFREQFFADREVVTCVICGRTRKVSRIQAGEVTMYLPHLEDIFESRVNLAEITIGTLDGMWFMSKDDVPEGEDPRSGVFFCGECAHSLMSQGARLYPIHSTIERVFEPVWERVTEKSAERAAEQEKEQERNKRLLRRLSKSNGSLADAGGTKRQRREERRKAACQNA